MLLAARSMCATRLDMALVHRRPARNYPLDGAVNVALVGEEHADFDQTVMVVP